MEPYFLDFKGEEGSEGSQKEGRTMAKDPVCGMDVEETKAAGRVEHEGQTYYFCSEGCQKAFEKMPDRYVQKKCKRSTPAAS